MELRRNGDNGILCLLTQDDLKQRGISLGDLSYSTLAVRKLFVEVLEEARQKLGFTVEPGQYKAEIIPMGDGSMQLLFSTALTQDEMDSRFVNFRPAVMKSNDEDGAQEKDSDIAAALRSLMNLSQAARGRNAEGAESDAAGQETEETAGPSADARRRFLRLNRMFVFENMAKACEAASAVRSFTGTSALYHSPDTGTYRLLLTMPDMAALGANQKSLITLSEYASQEVVTPSRLQSLQEHGELVIPDHAIEKLAEI
ncbi:MAG: adaptor protein MecA [Lachnospiraceae bacterium]|jgi:adapter protein MecA 1/2|nr:adaptor protein MecA [Lachnospiraceae bacterium]MCI1397355.1 adaptor protein MecA [Lachnospiraceae bacterium]MCI1422723.1 adaptor protein MecA [Lachnospiraceae bacterium]MCI1451641.1 adaptor protein MecA [Lachnospiraceae bacterium]MDD5849022.1 adaptor protein MecA [Bacillota bacterium]